MFSEDTSEYHSINLNREDGKVSNLLYNGKLCMQSDEKLIARTGKVFLSIKRPGSLEFITSQPGRDTGTQKVYKSN